MVSYSVNNWYFFFFCKKYFVKQQTVLNQDRKNKPYIRIACGKLLAGSILVNGNDALLIDCIELYI